MLPFVFDPDAGEHGALLGHVARNNPQWRRGAGGEALVIVRGPDAYVSPSWYASKAEHGRVVPTWNYVTAHVYGRLVVHDDPQWVEALVRRLTEQAGGGAAAPVVRGRRPRRVRRRATAGDRRPRAADHEDRGEGQAQPEPARPRTSTASSQDSRHGGTPRRRRRWRRHGAPGGDPGAGGVTPRQRGDRPRAAGCRLVQCLSCPRSRRSPVSSASARSAGSSPESTWVRSAS